MPFRNYFARRGAKHPVAYSNAVLALGVLVCMIIAVTIPIQMNARADARAAAEKRQADARAQQARDQGRRATCMLIDRMIKVYSEPEPSTETGRNAAKAWADLGLTFHCNER